VAFNREKLRTRSTDDFIANFSRVAQTSQYKVEFRGVNRLIGLTKYLAERGIDQEFVSRELGEYCRRAAVPGTGLFTKDADDQYVGVTQRFAYKRKFDEMKLTFYVDYEYKVQRFFELWQEYIMSGSSRDGLTPEVNNYYYRTKYPEEYKCERIRLLKFDRDLDNRIEYNFLNAFPRNISTTQISYDASRVLEVTVDFAYDRYVFGAIDSYSKALKEAFTLRSSSPTIIEQRPSGTADLSGTTGTPAPEPPVAPVVTEPGAAAVRAPGNLPNAWQTSPGNL